MMPTIRKPTVVFWVSMVVFGLWAVATFVMSLEHLERLRQEHQHSQVIPVANCWMDPASTRDTVIMHCHDIIPARP